MAGTIRKEDEILGADVSMPFVGVEAVVEQGETGSRDTARALRALCTKLSAEKGLRFKFAEPELQKDILDKPLREFEVGEVWYLGSFGAVTVCARKNEGFFRTDSQKEADVLHMCDLVLKSLKAQGITPPAFRVHFDTPATRPIIEKFCKDNGIQLIRGPGSAKSAEATKPPEAPSASFKLPR